MEKDIHIPCPCCKNKRIFEDDPECEGSIKIRCQICSQVITVFLHKNKIRTEQIGA